MALLAALTRDLLTLKDTLHSLYFSLQIEWPDLDEASLYHLESDRQSLWSLHLPYPLRSHLMPLKVSLIYHHSLPHPARCLQRPSKQSGVVSETCCNAVALSLPRTWADRSTSVGIQAINGVKTCLAEGLNTVVILLLKYARAVARELSCCAMASITLRKQQTGF